MPVPTEIPNIKRPERITEKTDPKVIPLLV